MRFFVPHHDDAWELEGVTGGANTAGYVSGSAVTAHCSRGPQRLTVTTTVGLAPWPTIALAIGVLRAHLERPGGLPATVAPFEGVLSVGDDEQLVKGVACGDCWAAQGMFLDLALLVEVILAQPGEVRLVEQSGQGRRE